MAADEADALAEAIAALRSRGRFGIRLGLGRTRALLRALGSPEAGLRGALIGGTNGKGSVQAMVGAVLAAAGARVGQTPKPHLVDYRERIVVDGRLLPPAEFAETLRLALAASERIERRHGPPTEFEVLTAAAFVAFARAGVEVAVIEVGLGGRLDATNVWDGGVAAVTNVALDHMEHLGASLTAIGREKAAIIKRGDRAITGASGEGLAPIRRRASRFGVPLVVAQSLEVVAMDRAGLRLRGPGLGELRLGLLGRHQAANAGVAMAILEALDASGIATVTLQAIRDGLASTRWPGRLELLAAGPDDRARPAPTSGPDPTAPDVLLDGAHNPAGMRAFVDALDELRPSLSAGRPTLLLGLMADKDVTGIVEPLAASAALRGARIITTRIEATRAMSATDLAAAWRATADVRSGHDVVAHETVGAALQDALAAARSDGGPMLVAGSLYLVGAVRGRLMGADG